MLGLEGAVAVAQQHAYRVTVSIGHDEVGFAVAVHIANRHRIGTLPVAKVCWAWKVPLPLPSSTLTVLLFGLATTRSGIAVAVHIANRHRIWVNTSGEGLLRLEGGRRIRLSERIAGQVVDAAVIHQVQTQRCRRP